MAWSYDFNEQTHLGDMTVVDSNTLERFIALFVGVEQQGKEEIVKFETREDIWLEIGDSENLHYELVKNKEINEELSINLLKVGLESMKVQIMSGSQVGYEVIVNGVYKNKYMSKILKRKDNGDMLMLTCGAKDQDIVVKIIEMKDNSSETIKVLFMYRFRDKEAEIKEQPDTDSV